jgi:hypothetical protein
MYLIKCGLFIFPKSESMKYRTIKHFIYVFVWENVAVGFHEMQDTKS